MPDDLRETWTPTHARVHDGLTLNSLLDDRVREAGGTVFAERKTPSGVFERITAAQLYSDVLSAARGLLALGLRPGDRVAIMANTGYDWSVVDFAVLYAGGVSVPVYATSSAEQLGWILADAGVSIAVAGTTAMGDALRQFTDTSDLRTVLVLEEGGLDELRRTGSGVETATLRGRARASTPETLATIVYTSGTTGRPKGVELTHGNFVAHVVNGADDPNFGPVVTGQERRTLLFLPLSHVFGRFIAFLCVYSQSVIGYVGDTKTLAADLQAFRPTWLLAVPRVFETFYNSALARAGTGPKRKLFLWAAGVAQDWSRSLDTGGPSLLLRAKHALADRLVLGKVRAALGGQARYAVLGGAPLAVWLGHFFRGVGLTVMEGYGLTELSAPTSVNRPGLIKMGSVGAPYPGTGVRIADDGEILVQGPNVFRGYRNAPEETAAAFVDGWFLTGDYGRLDADGYLHITGRKKEILVTAGGKNVQPALLENALRSHPLLSEVIVVGDAKPFIGALLAIDAAMLPSWLASNDLPAMPPAEAAVAAPVRAELDRAVAAANANVSRAEGIRKYVILPRELTEEAGELSASLKVRRSIVLEHFAAEFDSLYS